MSPCSAAFVHQYTNSCGFFQRPSRKSPPYMYSAGAYPCSAERRNQGIADSNSESVGFGLSIERPSSYSAAASPISAFVRTAFLLVGCSSHTAPVCGSIVCAKDTGKASNEAANSRKVRAEPIRYLPLNEDDSSFPTQFDYREIAMSPFIVAGL